LRILANMSPPKPDDGRRAAATRRIAIVAFPGVQLLDLAGPVDVFSIADSLTASGGYSTTVVSSRGGEVRTSSGIGVATSSCAEVPPDAFDTIVVAGGSRDGLVAALDDATLRRWVTRGARTANRIASVCSGAFALAYWRLLEGRAATTHWSAAATLRRHFPSIDVAPNALFVQDGDRWTSGGVTSGIDMCLAMVERDHGRWLALRVSRQLVMSMRRLGDQAQFDEGPGTDSERYADLIDWMRAHLRRPLDVAMLAERAHQSQRTFCRRFAAEIGETPARFVESLRLRAACARLEGGAGAKATARAAGFASEAHLARVFRRRLGLTPAEYRRLHSARGP